jgi:hypothetical protein
MACKLISYDLDNPNRNYDDLYEAIKGLGSWWHCLESVWLVDTTKTTAQVRDTLKAELDRGDKLAVFNLAGGWATYNLSDECNTWLRNRL